MPDLSVIVSILKFNNEKFLCSMSCLFPHFAFFEKQHSYFDVCYGFVRLPSP